MGLFGPLKPLTRAEEDGKTLARTLSWPHVMALGIGGIIGTGIYTLTGVGAGLAGPGVILAFALCGIVCACAALAYTEMSTMIPTAGSAYTYAYSALGEIPACICRPCCSTARRRAAWSTCPPWPCRWRS